MEQMGWILIHFLWQATAVGLVLAMVQLEAIVAHEVAHLVRRDPWVNAALALATIAFGFHPAVAWISRVIRREREFCCDELAAAWMGDRRLCAQALLRLEEQRSAQWALAATGGSLRRRIGRLLNPGPVPTPSLTPVLVLLAASVVTLLAGTAAGNAPQSTAPPPAPAAPAAPASPAAPVSPASPRPVRAAKPSPASEGRLAVEGKFEEKLEGKLEPQLEQLVEQTSRLANSPDIRAATRKDLEEARAELQGLQESASREAATMQELVREIEQLAAQQGATANEEAIEALREGARAMNEAAAEMERSRAAQQSSKAAEEKARRIDVARQRFGGASTPRGRVYVQYGPPDEIQVQPGPSGSTETREEWRYRPGPGAPKGRTFQFTVPAKR